MHELIEQKMWEALKEAVSQKDLNAVREVYEVLASYDQKQAKETPIEASCVQVEQESTDVKKLPDPKPKQQENSGPRNYHYSTHKCLDEFERDMLPVFAEIIKESPFSKGTILGYLSERFTLSRLLQNDIGRYLRTHFVDKGIIEIASHKTVRFTESYLQSLNKKEEPPALEAEVILEEEDNDEIYQHFEDVIIPRLYSEQRLRRVTVEELQDYFIRYSSKYRGCTVNYKKLKEYLEDKNLAHYEAPNTFTLSLAYMRHCTSKTYVGVDDVSALIHSQIY